MVAGLDTLSGSSEPDFKVGDWWVRPQRNELERGEQTAHIEARSMAVLVCLAHHAAKVVTKERLLKEVWSDTPFVGEEVISHAVWELRKTLGDSAKEPDYIQTIPRKGYRLLAEVLRPHGGPVPIEGVRIDHYEIQEELGRGSMGIVFKAVDQKLHRQVAIKFLAPELTRDERACQRFVREARLAASLDHPNLATVYEIGETAQGQRYLVTAYYGGGSLKERLMKGPLAPDEVRRLASQIAAGLGAAHSRGIVHRDIKPANLLLDEHGNPKIADFGIAKLQGGTDLTRTGASLGTPAYKSPEQSRGEEVDHRTDLWSLGVVLFEMATGRRPFDGEYEQAVVYSILSQEPEATVSAVDRPVPEDLRKIIAKAMAKKPADRYQSAQEMAMVLDGPSEPLRPLPRWSPATRKIVRRISLAGAGITLVITLLFATKGGLPPGPKPPGKESKVLFSSAQARWLRGNHNANLDETERLLQEVVEREPQWAEALAYYAVFKADRFAATNLRADREAALELIQKARSEDPQSPLAMVAEGRLLLMDAEYPDDRNRAAETLLRQAMAADPHCVLGSNCDLAYVWLGEALWNQGRKTEAMRILEEGSQEGEGAIRCRLKMAQAYKEAGDSSRAAVAYKTVLGLDDEQTTALNDLGILNLNTNQYEEAADDFRRLFRKTGDPRAVLNLGHALYGQKRWNEAVESYLEADRINRDQGIEFPTPAVSIGDVYLEQGLPTEAKPWFERALASFDLLMRTEERKVWRMAQRAVCLGKLGRFEEAEGAIRELLLASESGPDILLCAARIQALKKDRRALIDYARRAIVAGIEPHRLVDDAAFIAYREDEEYRRALELKAPPLK